MTDPQTAPRVSVIVPCRNEVDHIECCVQSMLSQESPEGGFELIIADGLSNDGTLAVLNRLARENPSLRILENAGRIVSTGLNAAIRASRGQIIIRVDVHTLYATNYLRECVSLLEASGADNVGGPWSAIGTAYVARAIAAVFHSRLGAGGARSHDRYYDGPVDTVYLGCWWRHVLDRVGHFDEELVRNQDDELNLRITRAGGTIWQSTRIRSRYHPRNSLRLLFQQYQQYGYWKVRVIQKHRMPASWRHVVPAVFVFGMIVLACASAFSTAARAGFAYLSGLYIICALGASLMVALATERQLLLVLPAVFACLHLGYGFGFLRGLWDFMVVRRPPSQHMSAITRGESRRR